MTRQKASLYLFLFLASFFTLIASLRIDSGDGATMYKVAESLLAGHGGAIPVRPLANDEVMSAWGEPVPLSDLGGGDSYGKWGRDGRYYAKYGPGMSLAVLPPVGLAKATSRFLPTVTEDYAGRAAMVWFNALITAWTCVLLFQLLTQFYPDRLSITLAILYGLGTFACYYAKSAFSEPLATLLLLLALFATWQKRYWLSGMALGGMLLVRQTTIFLVVPVIVWAGISIWRETPKAFVRQSAQLVIPVVLGQLAVWAYNGYRFGDWLEYGYMGVQWNTPFLLGLYGQLLSPGKGLFIFAPIVLTGVLGWPRFWRHRSWAVLILVLVVMWLIPHSLYSNWEGGGGWGPRLLLPIVPLCFFPAGEIFIAWRKHMPGRLALACLISLSILFQMLGCTANWARHLQRVYGRAAMPVQYFQLLHFNWRYAPVLGQLISVREELALISNPETREQLRALVGQAQASHTSDWQTQAVKLLSMSVPDYWFVYVVFLGILPPWGVLILIVGLVAMMMGAFYKLVKL